MTKLFAAVVIRTDSGHVLATQTMPLPDDAETLAGAYESAMRVAKATEICLQTLGGNPPEDVPMLGVDEAWPARRARI